MDTAEAAIAVDRDAVRTRPRLASLDHFRGLLILCMILENVLSMFAFMPAALKRSGVYGVWHLPDLGAPLFFFTIGVALGLSFDRYRRTRAIPQGVLRYIRRGVFLILLGTIGVLLLHHDPLDDWSVLQTIGVVGLVALPFVFWADRWRWVAGVGLILAFQLLSTLGYADWLKTHNLGGLGGPLGGLVWGGVALFGATLSQALRDDWFRFRRLSLTMAIAGLALLPMLDNLQPVDKRLATAPFLALTLGLSALVMFCFAYVDRRWKKKIWLFAVLGSNALAVLIVQGLFVTIGSRYISPDIPLVPALLFSALVFLLCIGLAGWLDHKKIYLRL